MHKVEQEANDLSACKDSASMYSISTADRHRAALYSDASEQFHLPLSVVLNVETFENVLELASRLHLNCLTQKCEDMLASTDFELTTGSSETDLHSVVRWAHIAQKHHLVALQLRCEQFMCNHFHHLVNDPLLQTLTRHSLLSMLRAQSAMLSVYQQHAKVPETWGLTTCGSHGALLRGRQQTASRELSSCSESDTDASCEDTDGADDSVPFDDLDSSSSCEVSELRDTADSKLCRPYSRPKRKQRHLTQSTLLRSWSHPGFPGH
ncbi:hypothetical protein ABBQ38_007094 [Trebouxia sp. C0009 RCD-2024]